MIRIALNRDQVDEVNLPENPAKVTDRRFNEYAKRFGNRSWELDALPPDYLSRLVHDHAEQFIDPEICAESECEILAVKAKLDRVASKCRL